MQGTVDSNRVRHKDWTGCQVDGGFCVPETEGIALGGTFEMSLDNLCWVVFYRL